MTEDRSWTPIELSPEHARPAGACSGAAGLELRDVAGFLIEVAAVAVCRRPAEARR